jgi:hypothetical protein
MSILEAFVLYGLALPFFAIALEASSLGSRLCMEAGYGVDTGRRTWARSAYRVQIEHELFGIVKLYAVTMHLCPNMWYYGIGVIMEPFTNLQCHSIEHGRGRQSTI